MQKETAGTSSSGKEGARACRLCMGRKEEGMF